MNYRLEMAPHHHCISLSLPKEPHFGNGYMIDCKILGNVAGAFAGSNRNSMMRLPFEDMNALQPRRKHEIITRIEEFSKRLEV